MINLTPHDITLRTPAGDVTYPASGQLARVSTIATPTGAVVAGVSVVRNTYGPASLVAWSWLLCRLALSMYMPRLLVPRLSARMVRWLPLLNWWQHERPS